MLRSKSEGDALKYKDCLDKQNTIEDNEVECFLSEQNSSMINKEKCILSLDMNSPLQESVSAPAQLFIQNAKKSVVLSPAVGEVEDKVTKSAMDEKKSTKQLIENKQFQEAVLSLSEASVSSLLNIDIQLMNEFCDYYFNVYNDTRNILNITYYLNVMNRFDSLCQYYMSNFVRNPGYVTFIKLFPFALTNAKKNQIFYLLDYAVTNQEFDLFKSIVKIKNSYAVLNGRCSGLMIALLHNHFDFVFSVLTDDEIGNDLINNRNKDSDGFELYDYAKLYSQNKIMALLSAGRSLEYGTVVNSDVVENILLLARIIFKKSIKYRKTDIFKNIVKCKPFLINMYESDSQIGILTRILIEQGADMVLNIVSSPECEYFNLHHKDCFGFTLYDFSIAFEYNDLSTKLNAIDHTLARTYSSSMYTFLLNYIFVEYINNSSENDEVLLALAKLPLMNLSNSRVLNAQYQKDDDLRTPLMHILCANREGLVLKILSDVVLLSKLNLNICDQNNMNLLHYAYCLDLVNVVKKLLQNFPELENQVSIDGKTPSEYCKINSYCDVCFSWAVKMKLIPREHFKSPIPLPSSPKSLNLNGASGSSLIFSHYSTNLRDPESPRRIKDKIFETRANMFYNLVQRKVIPESKLTADDLDVLKLVKKGFFIEKEKLIIIESKGKEIEYRNSKINKNIVK